MTAIIVCPTPAGTTIIPSATGTQGPPGPPGSGSSIAVKDEGGSIGGPFTTLNFTGAGVTASDAGSGVAHVDIPGGGGGSDETVELKDHSVVADGTTVNSSSALNTYLAGLGPARIRFPKGKALFDGDIVFTHPVEIDGYGGGSAQGTTDAATLLQFPAGKNGLVFPNSASGVQAQRSIVKGLTVYLPSALTTTATANYTAGSSTITITGGTNDYVAGQVIRLRGAGPSLVVQDRTVAISSGSNVATITNTVPEPIGNPGVYIGQPISIAGAGASGAALVGFVGAWTSTTITIVDGSGAALNASTTVSAAQYTITYPVVGRILSVSGSTITLDQAPEYTQSVTGARLDHCETGIYGAVTIDTEHVTVVGFTAAMLLCGHTTNNATPDQGNFYRTNFAGNWAGVICYGGDVNVNNFVGCNFAGPQLAYLDMTLTGSILTGCHFASNVGPVVTNSSTQTTLVACYLEVGTSYHAKSDSQAGFINCVGMYPRSGWSGLNFKSGVVLTKEVQATGPGLFAGGGGFGTNAAVQTSAFFEGNISGPAPNSGGQGVKIGSGGVGGTANYIMSLGAGQASYKDLKICGNDFHFGQDDDSRGRLSTDGWHLPAGAAISINGNQVVGARGAAIPALTVTATTGALPTADGSITIANAASPTNAELLEYCRELESKLEAALSRMRAATGHGLIA